MLVLSWLHDAVMWQHSPAVNVEAHEEARVWEEKAKSGSGVFKRKLMPLHLSGRGPRRRGLEGWYHTCQQVLISRHGGLKPRLWEWGHRHSEGKFMR